MTEIKKGNSRIPKFRAWDVNKSKYIEILGFYEDKASIVIWIIDEDNDIDYIVYAKTKIIIEQFTGCEDINGSKSQDVYDGSIILNCDNKEIQVVYWNTEKAAWYCRYVYDKTRIVSLADSLGNLNIVIGNIHENKELLK